MKTERCKCWHTFIARNGNYYNMQCSLERGHDGHCKWCGIRAECDPEWKAVYDRIDK